MLKEFADLHIHTTYSDGFDSPEVVIRNARRHSLKAIAITDHDTIDGIAEAEAEADKYGIELIPGIEVSASTEEDEIHILGYFIDCQDIVLRKTLDEVKEKRRARLKKMSENLKDLNINIDFDSLLKFAGPGVVGRLHLAHFLHKNKIVRNVYEAFDNYIGSNKPAYEKVNAFSPKEAIELILNAGGIPALAHPEPEDLENLIGLLMPYGLKGIEAYHPKYDKKYSLFLLNLAKKHNLLVTGGSDCHGKGKLTSLMGKVKLDYEYINKLKEQAKINCFAQ